jgi:hypothetical protein
VNSVAEGKEEVLNPTFGNLKETLRARSEIRRPRPPLLKLEHTHSHADPQEVLESLAELRCRQYNEGVRK